VKLKGGNFMTEKNQNLSRRKFITAGSAALAVPLVMGMAGKVADAAAAEKTEAASPQKKTYYINDNCTLCNLRCKDNCPAGAVYFDGDKMAINTDKCIRCGTCMKVCELSAVTDSSAQPPEIKPHDIIHRDCDVLILGGGTSGLIAAARIADMTKKKVIVLEKAKKAGGSGKFAMGVKYFSTKWQIDAGIPDQMDDFIRSAMNSTDWELNIKLVSNAFRSIPGFFDWFCTWGKPEDIYTFDKTARKAMQIQIKDMIKNRCTPLMNKVIEGCNKWGVEILTEHSATEFIMGDRGEIAGVKAKDPGGVTIFNCRYCLVATGNVINCGSLMARCVPGYVNVINRRSGHRMPTNTGDGVLMAEKAGIPVDYSSVCVTYTGVNSTLAESAVRSQEGRGEALYVNLEGKRWANETNTPESLLLKQPGCAFFNVMDSKILTMDRVSSGGGMMMSMSGNQGGRSVESGVPDIGGGSTGSGAPQGMSGGQGSAPGGQGGAQSAQGGPQGGMAAAGGTTATAAAGGQGGAPGGPGMAGGGWPPGGSGKTDVKELQRIAALSGRHVCIGNTLEELADKMGLDRKTFTATVKRYNELCAKGHDDDFLKPKTHLFPIEKAPFYAFSHYLGCDGAVGGLAINENAQVINKNGPIENLYAAGDTTGSRHIVRAGIRTEIINDMTWAVASGYLAGDNIGKQLKTI
jgi:succinate dehydrogenase/fumarate reductase flavoprotein subunit/NAD-dependent dihydropyrimidine dehydrogenase PreA subunit